jgi:3-methyladenine DNA glycosylase/8-oxoguanine DNA glycosylase
VTAAYPLEIRVEVRPPWPFRLPRHGGLDGLAQIRRGVLHRLLHVDGLPVWLRVAQLGSGAVLFGARCAEREPGEHAIEQMRRALGVDRDLRPFHERFRFDPLIGRAVRSDPRLRVIGRPSAFEALAFAICEQLIEFERAAEIQRRLSAALGIRCGVSGLRDSPAAGVLAAEAPARLESFGLTGTRAIALVRAAREVAAGRLRLDRGGEEAGWRRLRAIRGIGSWTVQKLALQGQGRLDQLPAGDLAYIKLVGRLRTGDPWARATEAEVEEFFAPYAPWAGLAGAYALRAAGMAAAAG